MTELTINFGKGEIKFRLETYQEATCLLGDMLGSVEPFPVIACRIETIGDDWVARWEHAQNSLQPQEVFLEEPWKPDPL